MRLPWIRAKYAVQAAASLWLSVAAAHAAEIPCADLKSLSIPATAIALASRGATIRSADVIGAAERAIESNGVVTPASPDYCKVIGTIEPVDPSAPMITFQVNLPTAWNGKALQYGGGGFNGTLVTGLAPAIDALPGAQTPLSQGYVTFGTDSGHQAVSLPEPQAFALNAEALENFAYASYKKVRDVAVEIIGRRYGRKPTRIYYMGTSEGGREGLTMAQRFPTDYDGIISRVPVINWTGLQHAGHRSGLVQQNGGWLSATKVRLLGLAVLKACDSLDRLSDGIVSNYLACGAAFNVKILRCPTGTDEGDSCLSDKQVAAIEALHSEFAFPFPLTNGVSVYPGFGYGGEMQPGGFATWVTATRPASFPSPAGSGQGQQWILGNGVIRYFILRNGAADPFAYSLDAHATRVKQISALMDSTNPDLSVFAAHGGKLIIKEHMADYAQSPFAGIGYYQSVVAKMGQSAVDQFMRLYITAGANHGGAGVRGVTQESIPQYVDLLGALDRWVDRRQSPDDLVQTSVEASPPFAVIASRPMCSFPKYPNYRGNGDPKLASNFSCEAN
jgi:feruloyl esterase